MLYLRACLDLDAILVLPGCGPSRSLVLHEDMRRSHDCCFAAAAAMTCATSRKNCAFVDERCRGTQSDYGGRWREMEWGS